jgi:hypothetical protein
LETNWKWGILEEDFRSNSCDWSGNENVKKK